MKIKAGEDGIWYQSQQGKIFCWRAPTRGIEERLYETLVQMVDALHYSIGVSSVDTGKHAATSRHYTGRAADIVDVHPYGQESEVCTVENPHARRMVEWLMAHGFQAGRENGPYDAVLLGPVGTAWNKTRAPHNNHAHVSIFKP